MTDVDYRVSCAIVVSATESMPEHELIVYGVTAGETHRGRATHDLQTSYREISRWGRRSGSQHSSNEYFFTYRMGRHVDDLASSQVVRSEESRLQDSGDSVRGTGSPDEGGSQNRLEQVATEQTRHRGGHRGEGEVR